ncbi:MAG: prepilin-type N-terminal cleavage/methylation domain-containing protein [Pseudomonadota bacterium]
MSVMSMSRPAEQGFTLVEVLLVVFIVGLSAGLVVMTLPEGPERLERERQRVEAALSHLEDRAVLTGQVHGVAFSGERFEVVRRVDGDWQADGALGLDLESPVEFLVERRRNDDGPQLYFDPAGVPVNYEIVLLDGRSRETIVLGDIDRLGRRR